MLFYILRGVPGCGKSTVSRNIAGDSGVVCEADNYFVGEDGIYRYDPKKIGLAHGWCLDITRNAMESQIPVVVLSNTNTDPLHFKKYEVLAEIFGYTVFHLIVENRHGGKDSHNVPEESLRRMEESIRANIKLGRSHE